MGRTINKQEILKQYKLTSHILQDDPNQQQLIQTINQLNQSLAEMARQLQQLNSQLTQYNQIISNSDTLISRINLLNRSSQFNTLISMQTELQSLQNQLQFQLNYDRNNQTIINQTSQLTRIILSRTEQLNHNIQIIEEWGNGKQFNQQKQQSNQSNSFFDTVFNYCKQKIIDFVQLLALSN